MEPEEAQSLRQPPPYLETAFCDPLPVVDEDGLWSRIAALMYRVAGSGTGLTLPDVLGMDWARMEWWLAWLEEQRTAEVQAIRKARGGKGG